MSRIKTFNIILILVGILFATIPAHSIDYDRYIDSTNGLNGNDGLSAATAWQSVSHAISQIPSLNMTIGDTLTLYLASGTYNTDTLETDTNLSHEITQTDVHVKGSGPGLTTLSGPGGSTGWTQGLTISADNVKVTGISFTGFITSGSGIYISAGTGVEITECDFTGNSYGIYLFNSSATDIKPRLMSNSMTNNNEGIYISSSAVGAVSPYIYFNTFSNNSNNGINIWTSSSEVSPDIHANDISGSSTGIFIHADSSVSSPTITSNTIHNNTTGIYVSGYNGNAFPVIRNNVIHEPATPNSDYGINILGGMTGSVNPEIYHNTIDGGGGTLTGIYMSNSSGTCSPVIKYNIISNMAQYGIENASGAATPFVDHNNMFNNTTGNYQNTSTATTDYTFDPQYEADFSIPQSSQCVDAIPASVGDAEASPVSSDKIGTSRPRKSGSAASADYDLGAFEYPYQEYAFTMPGGTGAASDYQMLTLPLTADETAFTTIFQTAYGTYDTTMWRIYTYNPVSSAYVEFNEAGFDSLMSERQGKSFWVISRDGAFVNDTHTFQGGLTGNKNPFYVYLEAGWNMVALPWPASSANPPIELQNLVVDDGSDVLRLTDAANVITARSVWEYNASGYVEQASLAYSLTPGTGYWLFVYTEPSKLLIPPDNAGTYFNVAKMTKGNGAVRSDTKGGDVSPPPPPGGVQGVDESNGCFVVDALKNGK